MVAALKCLNRDDNLLWTNTTTFKTEPNNHRCVIKTILSNISSFIIRWNSFSPSWNSFPIKLHIFLVRSNWEDKCAKRKQLSWAQNRPVYRLVWTHIQKNVHSEANAGLLSVCKSFTLQDSLNCACMSRIFLESEFRNQIWFTYFFQYHLRESFHWMRC